MKTQIEKDYDEIRNLVARHYPTLEDTITYFQKIEDAYRPVQDVWDRMEKLRKIMDQPFTSEKFPQSFTIEIPHGQEYNPLLHKPIY